MATKMDVSQKKCMTPEFRASFANVFEPKAFEGQEAKFSIAMLFPKTTNLKALQHAANNAGIEKWGPDKAKWPKPLRMPFRDGDEKQDLDGYKGMIYVGSSSKTKPGLIDQAKEPITKDDIGADGNPKFYSGCYARATLIAFAYDKAGNRGISFSLQNIQKLRDGKPFSGKKAAAEEFDAVEVDVASGDTAFGGEELGGF